MKRFTKFVVESIEQLDERYETKKADKKMIGDKEHTIHALHHDGEEIGRIYPHSATSQTKTRGSRIATSQKKVVRWGYQFHKDKGPESRYPTTGMRDKNHAAEEAIRAHSRWKEANESFDLDEAVEVRHDRYLRSHGKKARDSFGGGGTWAFTHKDRGDVDYKNDKEVYQHSGKFADAKKAAQQWGKKHGHREVYVMESVDLDEVSDKKLDAYRQKAFADQPSGDDGSDKYRKRKFGRDLAFAKQTGRAKVLATKEEVDLDEAKLSPQQRDRLDDLILNVHTTTHPEYDGGETPDKYLKAIEKEFGTKVAKQVKDGIEIAHWGRDNHSSGNDKLSWRKGGARITKSGKMNKQDVEALKNRIKRDKQWGGITKKVKLPEEVEQLDELSPKTLKSYVKKATGDAVTKAYKAGDVRDKDSGKNYMKALGRQIGISKATDKLAKEEVELDESVNDLVRVGQKMLELAPKEKNDMISNAYSNLGDALTRYGTPFGPKNVADLEKKTGLNQRIIMSLIKKVQQ